MRRCIPLLLVLLGAGCQAGGGDETAADTAGPDTTAVQGAGSVPHPTPAAADSLADSARAGRDSG